MAASPSKRCGCNFCALAGCDACASTQRWGSRAVALAPPAPAVVVVRPRHLIQHADRQQTVHCRPGRPHALECAPHFFVGADGAHVGETDACNLIGPVFFDAVSIETVPSACEQRRGGKAGKRAGGSPLAHYARTSLRNGSTVPLACGELQKLAQASISRRRFSNRSPRLYAFSTALGIACASAISATSFGKLVRSAQKSRNELRKPCVVMSTPVTRLARLRTLAP